MDTRPDYADGNETPNRMGKRISSSGSFPGCLKNIGLMVLVAAVWIGINSFSPGGDSSQAPLQTPSPRATVTIQNPKSPVIDRTGK